MTSLSALIVGTAAANTDVNFAFDSSALSRAADARIEAMANAALKNPEKRVVLDGHADPIGTAPYNVGLSLRRAQAVRDKLVARGVDRERIVISAYGEDAPIGASYPLERRVSMWLTTEPVADVIDHTFTRRGTSVSWEKPMTTAQLELPSTQSIATRR